MMRLSAFTAVVALLGLSAVVTTVEANRYADEGYFFIPPKLNASANYTVVKGKPPANALVWALYNNSFHVIGWDVLEIGPSKHFLASDPAEAYYVHGFLEGYLTQDNIYASYANQVEDLDLETDVNGTFMALHWPYISGRMKEVVPPPTIPPSQSNNLTALTELKLYHAFRMGRGVMDGYHAAIAARGGPREPPIEDFPMENITDIQLYMILNYMDTVSFSDFLESERIHWWNCTNCSRNGTIGPIPNDGIAEHGFHVQQLREVIPGAWGDASDIPPTTTHGGRLLNPLSVSDDEPSYVPYIPQPVPYDVRSCRHNTADNPNCQHMDGKKAPIENNTADHCFATVVVTDDDVFMSHVTWWGFNSMTRIYKIYHLEASITMSSCAGCIHSGDDFAISSNGIAITETTVDPFLSDIYTTLADPYSTPTSYRSLASLSVAKSGKMFALMFMYNESGTAAADWLIVDMNKYNAEGSDRDERLQEGFLHVVENYPCNATFWADATQAVRDAGFVALNNLAFFQRGKLFTSTEFPWPDGDPETTRRQLQIRRAYRNMKSMDDLKAVIRMNEAIDPNLETNPMIGCHGFLGVCSGTVNPTDVIANRRDIVNESLYEWGPSAQYSLFGGLDGKVISLLQVTPGRTDPVQVHAICGPTRGLYNELPTYYPNHNLIYGYPDDFDFDWETFNMSRAPRYP